MENCSTNCCVSYRRNSPRYLFFLYPNHTHFLRGSLVFALFISLLDDAILLEIDCWVFLFLDHWELGAYEFSMDDTSTLLRLIIPVKLYGKDSWDNFLPFAVVSGIAYLFFLINFEEIAVCVNKGTLDPLLLKPIDSQFFASTRYLALYNSLRAVVGIFIIISNVRVVSLPSLVLFLFILVCSIAMLYSIWLLVVTLNFYSQRLSNVIGLLLTIFDEVGRTPSDTFRIASSWAFTFLLPFFMIVSFPVKALWNKLPINFALATFGSAIVLFVLSRRFWKFSLRHYTSASSWSFFVNFLERKYSPALTVVPWWKRSKLLLR